MSVAERTEARTFRFAPDELAGIDAQARKHRLNRTEYIIRASLGELGATVELEQRLQAIEQDIQRLKQLADLT